MKKILSLILLFSLLTNNVLVAQASDDTSKFEEPDIQLLYTYTFTLSTSLSISNQVATCTSYLDGYAAVTKIVIEMTLQKESWLWWSTVETWSSTTYGNFAYISESYSVDSDNYRVKTVFTVYSGTDYETITKYSSEVEC